MSRPIEVRATLRDQASAGVDIQGPLIGRVDVSSDYDVDQLLARINRELEKAFDNG